VRWRVTLLAPDACLTFVGVGPRGPDGVPPAVLYAVAQAGAVFADDYTAFFPAETLAFLERARGDAIPRIGRARAETGTEILEAAQGPRGAALLVPGDPMAATTHVALRIEAVRRGIPVRLLFAPSITHTSFSEAGLQHYKSGRTVSLPWPEKGYAPTSPLENLRANRAAGLHTLVLLDIKGEQGRYMTASQALTLLLELSAKVGGDAFPHRALAVAVARAGESDAAVRAGAASRLAQMDFGPPMHCLIVPGALHFEEREALIVLCGAKPDELPPE
jgi:diphthine synthase